MSYREREDHRGGACFHSLPYSRMVFGNVYIWFILIILSVLVVTGGTEPQSAQAQSCGDGACPQAPSVADDPASIAKMAPLQDLSAVAPPSTPLNCHSQSNGGSTDYVSTKGSTFVYQGAPIQFYGYTFYPSTVGGTSAWYRPNFTQYIDHIMQMGAAVGQNLVRPTNYWSRNPNTENPVQGSSDVWSNMDYLVCAAQLQGVFVLMDLSAFRYLLVSQHLDAFDPDNWQAFLTGVGKHYRNQSSIAFYSIVGEPRPPTTTGDLNKLMDFYRQTTDTLRAADPNHLITVGAFNHMNDETADLPWWHQIYKLPNNDIAAFKTYSLHDLQLLPSIVAYAKQIGKPALDAELGMIQSVGDAKFVGGPGIYGLQMSRAQFYDRIYSLAGVQGFVLWNLGCGLGPYI